MYILIHIILIWKVNNYHSSIKSEIITNAWLLLYIYYNLVTIFTKFEGLNKYNQVNFSFV